MTVQTSLGDVVSPALTPLKTAIQNQLIKRLPPGSSHEQVRAAIEQEVAIRVTTERHLLTDTQQRQLVEAIRDDMLGLGPLEALLADRTVSEIMVNGHQSVWIEKRGRLQQTEVRFEDESHLLRIIQRIVGRVGRRIDESAPMVDARLPDGSRVNAIIPPLALDGAVLTIRKFPVDRLDLPALVGLGAMSDGMALFLQCCVQARCSILVSGGTGSGKTTLLNALSGFIPAGERLITIEDAAELQMQQAHVVRLETRTANQEGQGAVTIEQLLRNALRMRPDRVIIGEVRGPEALTMLQAMNTGHEGSLTTVHANTPRDAISRLETMVLMASANLPFRAIREQIGSALDLIVQTERLSDGSRRVTAISEITGSEGDVLLMQDVFQFRRSGRGADGTILGEFRPTGLRPRAIERFQLMGLDFPLQHIATPF
ncbi:MAG: CpaF family protein [Candidatus Sericytochromatia bacterium]|nr:CpaF family protein [Candidatus Sericytochromatia bacterium]